jgi:hypothetical protein
MVVEVKGEIANQIIFILIDLRSNHSYVTTKIVETCALKKCKLGKSWLVQRAIATKRNVSKIVEMSIRIE